MDGTSSCGKIRFVNWKQPRSRDRSWPLYWLLQDLTKDPLAFRELHVAQGDVFKLCSVDRSNDSIA